MVLGRREAALVALREGEGEGAGWRVLVLL